MVSQRAAYGYQKRKGHQEYVWNVFGNSWSNKVYVRAGHIFPLCLGQDTIVYIFGKDARDEINTARNGLWMPAYIEQSFDHHQIVIVPDDTSPNRSPREWKMLVLDRSLWNIVAFSGTTYAQLHNRKLSFRTESRPRARYFYFHFLISMIIRSRTKGNRGILPHEPPEYTTPSLSRAWGSEGSFLRENVIRGFIEELGHEIPPSTKHEMLGHSNQGIAEDEIQRMNKNIKAMNLESEESEDDDEYENVDSDEDKDYREAFVII